jgi:hypothetical protein
VQAGSKTNAVRTGRKCAGVGFCLALVRCQTASLVVSAEHVCLGVRCRWRTRTTSTAGASWRACAAQRPTPTCCSGTSSASTPSTACWRCAACTQLLCSDTAAAVLVLQIHAALRDHYSVSKTTITNQQPLQQPGVAYVSLAFQQHITQQNADCYYSCRIMLCRC